jgi:hypothetical protein
MPKLTQQAKLIRGLEGRGYTELTTRRYSGCRAYHHADRPTQLLFVGTGGSLRVGQNRLTCRVVSPSFKQQLMSEGS